MRFLLVAALMVTACADSGGTVSVEEVCSEEAESWCAQMAECGDATGCVEWRTGWCLDRIAGPVPEEDHLACLESLERLTCHPLSYNLWTEECNCAFEGTCH